jgi:hypothetical protein
MATLTIHLADDVKSLAEARTAQAGYANVAEYLTWLIRGEAAGAPQGLELDSDADLESLLIARLDGASGDGSSVDGAGVEMNQQDFTRLREKLASRLDGQTEPRP